MADILTADCIYLPFKHTVHAWTTQNFK